MVGTNQQISIAMSLRTSLCSGGLWPSRNNIHKSKSIYTKTKIRTYVNGTKYSFEIVYIIMKPSREIVQLKSRRSVLLKNISQTLTQRGMNHPETVLCSMNETILYCRFIRFNNTVYSLPFSNFLLQKSI